MTRTESAKKITFFIVVELNLSQISLQRYKKTPKHLAILHFLTTFAPDLCHAGQESATGKSGRHMVKPVKKNKKKNVRNRRD
jgi:hypothetical protein